MQRKRTHNSAHINAVEVDGAVLLKRVLTTVNKTTSANGEAVYTIDANVDHHLAFA